MSARVPIAVVGAGPAGLAAAVALAEAGLPVVLLDDNARAGGQIFRAPPGDGTTFEYPEKDPRGDALRARAARLAPRLEHRTRRQVVAAHEGRQLWVYDEESGKVEELTADHLVIASGALEVPMPVPGWTLPGVYMLGGLQNLVKAAGMVPEGRVVLAGAGPLLFLVAAQMARLGVQVAAVVDAAGMPDVPQLWGLAHQPLLLAKGAGFELSLRRRGVPILRRHAVARIEGDGRPARAVVTRLDRAWKPVAGSEREIACEVVGIGFGLRPNVELVRLLGCAVEEIADLGGVVPVRSAVMETSVAGVFAVGDGAGIGGVEVALAEGAIAAAEIAARAGASEIAGLKDAAARAQRLLARDRPFHDALARWSAIRPGILDLVTDDTVVCRCEDVDAAEIRSALAEGLTHPGPLKMRTRVGMGFCQGRVCSTAVRAMIAAYLGSDPATVPAPSVRIPLRPVPAGAFTALPIAPKEPCQPVVR